MTTWSPQELEVAESITGALRAVGVERGDLVLMHSDASAVIKMLGSSDWGRTLDLLGTACLDAVGPEGTVVVPTFNWAFCKGQPYDARRTPSVLGLFSNYLRLRPDAVRSPHPIFSFAAIGPQATSLFSGISKSSFGEDSVFDRLRRRDAKLVFLNTSFYVCTFVHHVEQMAQVPYRYLKHFTGTVSFGGPSYEDTFDFYVRDEKLVVNSYPTRLGERMREQGALRAAPLGSGEVLGTTCQDVYRDAMLALQDDPFVLLKDPPASEAQ